MSLRRAPLTAIVAAVLSALLLLAGTAASVAAAQSANAAQSAGVPWNRVGPGWVLAQYTTAAPEGGKTGPVTLYLISPGGARYQLARWPDMRFAPQLVAWSPDGKRALFQVFSGKGGVEQLTLATGWQLRSGLYLQAAGPCGVLQIFRQARSGSIKLVTVPHTNGDNRVLTARGSRLLIQAPTDCTGSVSLLWYDPGTRAEQWLIRPPANVIGVTIAIPFYSRENGSL
jgi:hypothetical protein